LIWDILSNIGSDYRLLFKHKITRPTLIYFLSRASILVYTLLNTTLQTASHRHCLAIARTSCVLCHVAFSSTAFLFFLRVRAVFNKDKYVVGFFFIVWLGILGVSVATAAAGKAVFPNPTHYCIGEPFQPYVGAVPTTVAINDTLVFLAISWRLLKDSWPETGTPLNLGSFFRGEYLPACSKAVLQDGQVYYLIAVTSNLTVVVLGSVKGVPYAYQFMFTVFNCALTNMMACRVYRQTKLGTFKESAPSTRQWAGFPGSGGEVDTSHGSSIIPLQVKVVHYESQMA